jgi:hypothetical protein
MVTLNWVPVRKPYRVETISGTGCRMVLRVTGMYCTDVCGYFRVSAGPLEICSLLVYSGAIFLAVSYEEPIARTCPSLYVPSPLMVHSL